MGALSDVPRLRLTDRVSMRWRLARAWRLGTSERRAGLLGAARAFEGSGLEGLRRQPGGPLADSELRFSGGRTLRIGRSHCATFDRLARALGEGPVHVERVADHRRFFGVYFQTVRGRVALLVDELVVGIDGGGLRRPVADLSLI